MVEIGVDSLLGRLVCLLLKPKRVKLANFVLVAVFGYIVLAG